MIATVRGRLQVRANRSGTIAASACRGRNARHRNGVYAVFMANPMR